ncbi:MAG TPA: hypothetical protein VG826_36125 [Pirellulales bacterium]|nr:hypothetical protein [Pirellulales bacterium]
MPTATKTGAMTVANTAAAALVHRLSDLPDSFDFDSLEGMRRL